MKNKTISIFLVLFIIFNFFSCVYADDDLEEELPEEELRDVLETSVKVNDDIKINSRYAVAYDRKSKMFLYGKNEKKRTAMASTTKIMTAICLVENGNLKEVVTISKKAAGTGGSRLGLKQGDKILVRDLLYGLLLRSGNDAAVAIAEYVSGSVENFANLMNQKAKEMNLIDTHFVTPHGLDNDNHYTTAEELAKITDYALNNKVISNIVATKFYTININGKPKALKNTNELLGNLEGVNGVKTGFTNKAGRCLVSSVKRGDFNIIVVVLGADTKKDRTKDSVSIIEHIYKNYEVINIEDQINLEFKKWESVYKNSLIINKAKIRSVELKKSQKINPFVAINKYKKEKLDIKINTLNYLDAPVDKDFVVGKMTVKLGEKVIGIEDIYVNKKVPKKELIDYVFECLKCYKNKFA